MAFNPPSHDCPLCPRLVAFRQENRKKYPGFFNGPVPSFGELSSPFLVVGLAPGLKGANRTGRPFTGDYAGLVLYSSLRKYGFAEGEYDPEKVATSGFKHGGDGFKLRDCRITNAVRCVPQANKPEPLEIRQCNNFLAAEMGAMPNLRVVLSLGQIAHKAVIMASGLKQSDYIFRHGAEHVIHRGNASPAVLPHIHPREVVAKISSMITGPLTLLNSYHCSRYNINTGTLTQAMFDEVVKKVRSSIEA